MQIAEVIKQEQITDDIYRITLGIPDIAGKSRPGQFVHVRVTGDYAPLLRRPFSIHRRLNRDQIQLLYRRIGAGTTIMTGLKPGDKLDVMGPLGNGFSIPSNDSHAIIIGGGMGAAPVFFLIEKLIERSIDITFFWGARTGKEIFDMNWLAERKVTVNIACEDGSKGHHGLITDPLPDYFKTLAKGAISGYVCGPKPMLNAIQPLVRDLPFDWQASMEEVMACGEGICMGCAAPRAEGGYAMVCKDGPVFKLQELKFNG